MSGSKSKSREKKKKTKTNTNTNTKKKKNSGKEAKQKPVILTVSSSSDSEERNEVEEEAKSSNNSNQHMNDETLDDDRKDKNVSSGSGNGGGASGSGSGSSCCFPTNRIQRIIRSEGTDFRITQEAIFLINKATEHFLEIFCEDAYASGRQDHQKAVSYKHLSSVVGKGRRYDFLSDFVPEKVRAEDALSERLAET